jgi:KDO2-lipid IV(A) lauroyltransferase
MKSLRYKLESLLVKILLGVFRMISPSAASNIGGAIGKMVGPRLAASRKAKRNIALALPDLSYHEIQDTVRDMWENLGRVMAEYPHLAKIARDNTQIIGKENLASLLEGKGPAILFAGHFANWEMAATSLETLGIQVDLIYRAPNNPEVDEILQRCRSLDGTLRTYPKSRSGMRQVVEALKQGRNIGILIDQKYNEGIPAQFFGRTAMTSPAFAQLARKFKCPLIPVRVERLDGVRFRVSVLPPLDVTNLSDEEAIAAAHKVLEGWIRERPGEWLWLHRRWRENA